MSSRFEPATIKNKIKREEIAKKAKKAKTQQKLEKRLARAKQEANDPAAKKRRIAENVPKTLDNTREFDPSILTANPSSSSSQADPSGSSSQQDEAAADFASDPFASYFDSADDPMLGPKVLITTGPKATKLTYDFCEELVAIFPGAEFIRRKKGKGFEMGRIAGWAAGRGYKHLCVVNEDMKRPNAITLVHLPNGPTAYFKLTSVELTKRIFGHARATAHNPELVLNNFVTRLGHAVGRMFQTLFPPMPEFQGRQVVTLHNQRDFLFFRRHRYAFRSTEKVALQEIGPRFTLKLRWLKKGIPSVQNFGEEPKGLEFDVEDKEAEEEELSAEKKIPVPIIDDNTDPAEPMVLDTVQSTEPQLPTKVVPPKQDEFIWAWKPELEVNRRTFFL